MRSPSLLLPFLVRSVFSICALVLVLNGVQQLYVPLGDVMNHRQGTPAPSQPQDYLHRLAQVDLSGLVADARGRLDGLGSLTQRTR
jgi:hypothetical protein